MEITEKEHNYSNKQFGKPLCRTHQKSVRNDVNGLSKRKADTRKV